jgi:peptide/nickel transport system permease protein
MQDIVIARDAVPHHTVAFLRFVRHGTALLGALVLIGILSAALFAPLVAPVDPYQQRLADRIKPPTWSVGGSGDHPLGTDFVGRDLMSRVIYGARVSLLVAGTAVAIAAAIGVPLGLVAGYYGGSLDAIMMAAVDIMLTFPYILLALAVVGSIGPGLRNLIIVLGITSWPLYARIVRGEVLAIRQKDYLGAAYALGATDFRVLLVHVLPNIASSIIVLASLETARVILAESALSFLGLGVPPPTPSWGSMLSEGRQYLEVAWWLAIFPGMAILLTVLAINLVGDGIRDALDPKMRSTPRWRKIRSGRSRATVMSK